MSKLKLNVKILTVSFHLLRLNLNVCHLSRNRNKIMLLISLIHPTFSFHHDIAMDDRFEFMMLLTFAFKPTNYLLSNHESGIIGGHYSFKKRKEKLFP